MGLLSVFSAISKLSKCQFKSTQTKRNCPSAVEDPRTSWKSPAKRISSRKWNWTWRKRRPSWKKNSTNLKCKRWSSLVCVSKKNRTLWVTVSISSTLIVHNLLISTIRIFLFLYRTHCERYTYVKTDFEVKTLKMLVEFFLIKF